MELTDRGQQIFEELQSHCVNEMQFKDIDTYGLELLANAFDTYAKCAEVLNEKGLTQSAPKTGFEVVRPEVGVMKSATEIIAKLSDRFGLNPDSRKKIFGKVEQKKPKSFDLGGGDKNGLTTKKWQQ